VNKNVEINRSIPVQQNAQVVKDSSNKQMSFASGSNSAQAKIFGQAQKVANI
jgi:hypothetical protein